MVKTNKTKQSGGTHKSSMNLFSICLSQKDAGMRSTSSIHTFQQKKMNRLNL